MFIQASQYISYAYMRSPKPSLAEPVFYYNVKDLPKANPMLYFNGLKWRRRENWGVSLVSCGLQDAVENKLDSKEWPHQSECPAAWNGSGAVRYEEQWCHAHPLLSPQFLKRLGVPYCPAVTWPDLMSCTTGWVVLLNVCWKYSVFFAVFENIFSPKRWGKLRKVAGRFPQSRKMVWGVPVRSSVGDSSSPLSFPPPALCAVPVFPPPSGGNARPVCRDGKADESGCDRPGMWPPRSFAALGRSTKAARKIAGAGPGSSCSSSEAWATPRCAARTRSRRRSSRARSSSVGVPALFKTKHPYPFQSNGVARVTLNIIDLYEKHLSLYILFSIYLYLELTFLRNMKSLALIKNYFLFSF